MGELAQENLDFNSEEYVAKFDAITVKTCLCEGLSNAALIKNNIEHKGEEQGVAVCPGPNMAYFSKELSLKEMVSHIYGKTNIMTDIHRPHMFIKELKMYVDYFSNKVNEVTGEISRKQDKYLNTFYTNLNNGIGYYQDLFLSFESNAESLISELNELQNELFSINIPVFEKV